MGGYARDGDRRIIPRWLWLSGRKRVDELPFLGDTPHEGDDLRPVLDAALAAWRHSTSDIAAGELCAAALLVGDVSSAQDAGEYLMQRHAGDSSLRLIGSLVVGGGTELLAPEPAASAVKIRVLRQALRSGPRNPIKWADLARSYAIIGKQEAARDAMVIAEQLGRGGRVIARAAARCFIHAGDTDRAHDCLIRSGRVQYDPWVLAAEIAVANISGMTSQHTKVARKMVGGARFSDTELSDLRIALASQECWFGQRRLGRRMAQDALRSPTENGLAQIAWLVRHGFIEVPVVGGDLGRSAEARAWTFLNDGKFTECLAACDEWWSIEQFSSRPSELGSYVAATALGDPHLCIEQARRGLRANPSSVVLWNNLAVGLAESGKVEEAANALRRAVACDVDAASDMMLGATRGLIEFRRGHNEAGRREYEKAIQVAESTKDRRGALLARLYYLREERRVGVEREDMVTVIKLAGAVEDVGVVAMATRLGSKASGGDI